MSRSPRLDHGSGLGPVAGFWVGALFAAGGLGCVVGGWVGHAARSPSAWVEALPLFGLSFIALGIAQPWSEIVRRRGTARRRRMLAGDPRRPWRSQGAWRGLATRSPSMATLLPEWLHAGFFALFAHAFLHVVRGTGAPLAMRIAGWCGVGLAVAALLVAGYSTLQRWKWGRVRMTFRRLPVRPGELVEGLLFCGRRVAPEGGFELTLVCAEDRITRAGSDETLTRRDLHVEKVTVGGDLLASFPGEGTAIPVRLPIPVGLPPSSWSEDLQVYWELEVEAATRGIDFAATLLLPVYACDDALVEWASTTSAACSR